MMLAMFKNNNSIELISHDSTSDIIRSLVEKKTARYDVELKEDAFFIGDLGDIINKYKTWCELLPRIEPFYAVKCNPDQAVLQLLAHLGTSFDCASKDEIESVLKLGVSPNRIVYANPCKQKSFIRYAAKHKVKMMTFDNEVELDKIKLLYPDAHLIIRILPPSNFKVQCDLGLKFGCHPNKAMDLLEKAKFLGLNVKGVSFHVGSGAEEVEAFSAAVKEAYTVFNMGLELGLDMTILDVGGGFPGQKTAPICFEEVATVLNEALDEYFPPESGVRIIAEPGRYFVASAFTLTANTIAKRMVSRDNKNADGCVDQCVGKDDEPAYMYYLNDGVYGSFNCLLFDHAHVAPSLLRNTEDEMEFTSSVWGPTCDSIDLILEDYMLPELHVGEWIYFEDMGAYTMCASSTFNGMPKPKVFFYCQEDQWLKTVGLQMKMEAVPKPLTPVKMRSGHNKEDEATQDIPVYSNHFLVESISS